jgi:hypothetical protein
MTVRSASFLIGLLIAAAASAAGGCSLFYDLNATQCEVTADCRALGSRFDGTSCVDRVCVRMSSVAGGGNTGSGGAGDSGNSGQAGAPADAGDAGAAGAAGTGTTADCQSNADCIAAHLDQPYICRDEKCQALTTSECPVLLPSRNNLSLLKGSNPPIVVGGFASMTNAQDPHDTAAVINWDLAFDEFDTALGVGSKQPPMLALVCQGLAASFDLTGSMTHLTDDVRTPAILSTLAPDDLFDAWSFTQTTDYMKSGDPAVFFMSTGSADLRLANLDDNGLMWHMLGDPRVLAATTVSLLEGIEAHVNALRQSYFDANSTAAGVEDPSKVPLRVTLIYSDDPTMTDIAKVLTTSDQNHPETLLTFNGKAAIDPANSGNFRQVQIESAKYHQTPVIANGVADLQQHPPHVVIAMATSEFPSVMSTVEQTWIKSGAPSVNMPRPFYLLSHFIYGTQQLSTPMQVYAGTTPPLNHRSLGVNYAEAQDAHSKGLYNTYFAALQSSYSGALTLDGTKNHYDGAYSLLYSVTTAGMTYSIPQLDGNGVRDAWQDRIISQDPNATSVDVGYAAVGNTIGNLAGSSTYRISLWGTMGPPDFDRLSGTRISATSAWCIQLQSGSSSVWEYQADGLLYDTDTLKFVAPAAGIPTCLQDYMIPSP